MAIYALGLVLEWIEAQGGVTAVEKRNDAKAKLLYDTIDGTGYYNCPVEKDSRSKMNVVFRVAGGRRKSRRNSRKKPRRPGWSASRDTVQWAGCARRFIMP